MDYNWDYQDVKSYNNRTGHYKFKKEYSFIERHKGNTSRILDIAGGSGRFAIPLKQYSKDVTVVDINEEAIRLIKNRDEEINAICGDFMDVRLSPPYTLILCIEALGYFKDLSSFFEKCTNMLDEKGTIIIMYNNPYSWRFFLRKIKHLKSEYYSYNEINLCKLKNILSSYGLRIAEMEGMNWIPLSLNSNSWMVSFFEIIERFFYLKKWYSQSPWILMAVKKNQK